MLEGKNVEFSVSTDGILQFKGRLCIPNDAQLKEQVQEGENAEFIVSSDGVLHFKGRLCISDDAQLKE